MQIVEFTAAITETHAADGVFTARLVPFGETFNGHEFQRGSLRSEGVIPLTVDHGDSVLDRVGVMATFVEDDTGAYGSFQLADTAKGNELRSLLRQGAVTDVSVGVRVDEGGHGDVMYGSLHHVSLVADSAFGNADSPSRVLSVHNKEGAEMPEDTITAPEVVAFDDSEIKAELVKLADTVDQVRADIAPAKPEQFAAIDVLSAMVKKGAGLGIANHALADVVGDLGTADASGIVPDAYWGAGLQMKIDRRRPLFAVAGSAPFPSAGNNLEVPKESQTTVVTKRTAEKGAAGSQAWQAVLGTYPVEWFSGAVDISLEIISQSDPSILSTVMVSLLNQYATATEANSTTNVAEAALHTGAALDTATYAALVGDIITTSDLIEDATGLPGDLLGVTSAQWIAILSLMDGGDRRQFSVINPQNADGSGSLTTRGIDVGGVFIFRAPAATTALQFNSSSYKNGEKSPMTVAAENVELMGRDLGILGATVDVLWAEGIYSYEIV